MSKDGTGEKGNTEKEEIRQAVLLADDFSEALSPMHQFYPSALVPVVGVPLLDYTTETLLRSGIHELYLYCSSHVESLRRYVQEKDFGPMTVTVLVSDGCRSLGDALRDIDAKGLIRGAFILIRGDSFFSGNLAALMDAHCARTRKDKGAAMTLVLRELGSTRARLLRENSCVIVTDSSHGRVLFHRKLGAEEKSCGLELQFFLDHSRVQIHSSLLDTHVYLCSASFLPLFSDNFDFQTLDDFVRGVLINEEILDSRIYWHPLDSEEYALPVTSWGAYRTLSRDILQRRASPLTPDAVPNPMNCVYLRRSTYRHRSGTLAKGCTLRRDSTIGPNTKLGEKTFVTDSVIGRDCDLGSNVKIKSCYIFPRVTIQNDCTIESSVVFSGACLGSSVRMSQCFVSPDVKLPTGSSYRACHLLTLNDKICEKPESPYPISEDHEVPESASSSSESSSGQSSDEDAAPLNCDDEDDDTSMFLTEVIDSLLRGYQDRLSCENLILEINSSRYAYNVGIREVTYNVVKAILSLPLHYIAETKGVLDSGSYGKTLKPIVTYFHPIVLNYVKNGDGQEDCLRAIEDTANSTGELVSFLQYLLHHLYDRDVLSEEKILEWYEESAAGGEEQMSAEARKAIRPFIEWLRESDEEESESD